MPGPADLPESVKAAQRLLERLDWLAYRLREEGRPADAEALLAASEALVRYVSDRERALRRGKRLDGQDEQA